MEISTACTLINEMLIFFPGWEISAEPHDKRFEGAVKLHIIYPTFNTNRETVVDGHYSELIKTYADFPFFVVDLKDQNELMYRLTTSLTKIFQHEIREALRFRPTGYSPLHPHRQSGIKRWLKYCRKFKDDDLMMVDVQFGTA